MRIKVTGKYLMERPLPFEIEKSQCFEKTASKLPDRKRFTDLTGSPDQQRFMLGMTYPYLKFALYVSFHVIIQGDFCVQLVIIQGDLYHRHIIKQAIYTHFLKRAT